MRFRLAMILGLCAVVATVAYGFFGRIEQSRQVDPSGSYFAVWSHPPYRYLPIVGLGTGSDSPCFVKIIDRRGRNYGEIPVPSRQVADVSWQQSGAEIQRVGEWNFVTGTCWYWSDDQTRKVQVRR